MGVGKHHFCYMKQLIGGRAYVCISMSMLPPHPPGKGSRGPATDAAFRGLWDTGRDGQVRGLFAALPPCAVCPGQELGERVPPYPEGLRPSLEAVHHFLLLTHEQSHGKLVRHEHLQPTETCCSETQAGSVLLMHVQV